MNYNNYLYYTRNSYNLSFYNYNAEVTGHGGEVQYQASIKSHEFTPDYPSTLEPDAYVFEGWYLNPFFKEGDRVNFDTFKMPASDVILYAHWVPKTHKVNFYLTKDAETTIPGYSEQIVSHGEKATPVSTPENGSYTFVGWFYDSDGTEKAFDIANMPVNRDLNLYAKWSSNTLMTYTLHYQLENGTPIAPDTTGSALAGSTKTFEAKTGAELNEGYQSGYFPQTASHSMTVDIGGNDENQKNVYTFIYVPKAEVNYKVQYLEKDTNKVLAPEKTGKTSSAVITEQFKQITGYAPDAYQKRLVLSATESENVITFWYVEDKVHAPVQIIHWIQNIEGNGYTEYQSSTNLNGVIGNTYTETPLSIPGFQHNATASNASGKLTAAGLVLNLKYDRIMYPYAFKFMEQSTTTEIATAVTGTARYQAQVTQSALTILGYTLVSPNSQAINIAIEEGTTAEKNVKIFYYTEQTVDIKYQVVGPENCGMLDNYQENQLKVITGTAAGSTPTAAEGFKFVGWYKDEACTDAVNAEWVNTDSNKLTPGKTGTYGTTPGYEAATYYAKFEYDVADLTITKQGWKDIDENQSFVFNVRGVAETGTADIDITVVVVGNGSTTIKDLPVGQYTVTEETSWSWRYTPDSSLDTTTTVNGGADATNNVTFVNSRAASTIENTVWKWLNGCAYCQNAFGKPEN